MAIYRSLLTRISTSRYVCTRSNLANTICRCFLCSARSVCSLVRFVCCVLSSDILDAQAGASAFRSARLTRHYEVRPILELSTSCEVAQSDEYPFTVYVDVKNTTSSSNVVISQISTLSPVWSCSALSTEALYVPSTRTLFPHVADISNSTGAIFSRAKVPEYLSLRTVGMRGRGRKRGSSSQDSCGPSCRANRSKRMNRLRLTCCVDMSPRCERFQVHQHRGTYIR